MVVGWGGWWSGRDSGGGGAGGAELLRVRDLLTPDGLEWDLEMLDITFDREGVNMIRTVPLGRSYRCDIVSWRLTGNGIFSTRSGYFDAYERVGSTDFGHFNIYVGHEYLIMEIRRPANRDQIRLRSIRDNWAHKC